MKITKRSWFFQLLGLLALMLAFGVMLAGCDAGAAIIGGGLVLGGVIGYALGHVFSGIITGGVIAFIVCLIITIISPRSSSSSSSSGGGSSSYDPVHDSGDRRRKGERTCYTCLDYSFTRGGVCKRSDTPKPAEHSCNNWR